MLRPENRTGLVRAHKAPSVETISTPHLDVATMTGLHEILDTVRCAERALPAIAGLAETIYRYSEGCEMTDAERRELQAMRAIISAGRH